MVNRESTVLQTRRFVLISCGLSFTASPRMFAKHGSRARISPVHNRRPLISVLTTMRYKFERNETLAACPNLVCPNLGYGIGCKISSATWLLWLLMLAAVPCYAVTPTDYYNHIVFDNSITPDYYYYSSGRSVFPSTVQLLSGALPVDKKNFFTPPNALRLQWHSAAGGSWETEVRVVSMRNRPTDFRGDTLYLWCYSPEAIPAADLPVYSTGRRRSRLYGAAEARRHQPATCPRNDGFRSGSRSINLRLPPFIPFSQANCTACTSARARRMTRRGP